MTASRSFRGHVAPEGASSMAPGEEIVLQQHPTGKMVIFGVICLFGLGLLSPLVILGDGNPKFTPYAMQTGVVFCVLGAIAWYAWRRHAARTRLTVTTRRVILEKLGRPDRTKELLYSPTFSVTFISYNAIPSSVMVQASGKSLVLNEFSKLRELAETIAGLREYAVERQSAEKALGAEPAAALPDEGPAPPEHAFDPASPDDGLQLADGEQLLARRHASEGANPQMIAQSLLLAIPAAILFFSFAVVESDARYVCLAIAVALTLGILVVFYAWGHYGQHTQLTITTHRIRFRGGWFSVTEMEIPVAKGFAVDWTRNTAHPVITIASPDGVIKVRGVRDADHVISLLLDLATSASAAPRGSG